MFTRKHLKVCSIHSTAARQGSLIRNPVLGSSVAFVTVLLLDGAVGPQLEDQDTHFPCQNTTLPSELVV